MNAIEVMINEKRWRGRSRFQLVDNIDLEGRYSLIKKYIEG